MTFINLSPGDFSLNIRGKTRDNVLVNEANLIDIHIQPKDGFFHIVIDDNGAGWPLPDRERLLEPYVTTRDEGTGLGLAIVKHIIEGHDSKVSVTSTKDKGSSFSFRLPLGKTIAEEEEEVIDLEMAE